MAPRRELAQAIEDIRREITAVGALLDDGKIRRFTEALPHLRELPGEQSPEERADAHVREEIAAAPDARTPRGVVPVLGMIEREFHESPERHRAARGDFSGDDI